jgi:hypothetical protein
MKPATFEPPRERKSTIVHFRVPASVETSLAAQIDPASGIRSVNDVARVLTLQALAKRERQRQLLALNVYKLKHYALLDGDAGRLLPHLPARAFRTCITSPPYWRQRNYNHPEQVGQECDPEQYINRLADIFMQVHRTLTDDGTLWVNIDDSYHHKELRRHPLAARAGASAQGLALAG